MSERDDHSFGEYSDEGVVPGYKIRVVSRIRENFEMRSFKRITSLLVSTGG